MMVPPGVVGYSSELDQRSTHDPERAKRCLPRRVYPGAFSVTLDCPNDRYINDEAVCRASAAQLSKVGIALAVNVQTKNVIFDKHDNRETDLYLLGWAPHNSHEIFVPHYRTGVGENAPGYSNPRVDELIDKIDREMVTYARDALIEEVWRIVLDDIVYMPPHHQVIVWAMRDTMDLAVQPFDRPSFREARFK
jgi:peptide/nickel transport system substrate-binding protein